MNEETVENRKTKNNPIRKNPWVFYVLIIISLLLPFVTVSCDGEKSTYTGIQLVTGSKIDSNGHDNTMYPQPFIIGTFAAAMTGLIIVLLRKSRNNYIFASITNAVAMILLIFFNISIGNTPQNESASINFEIGYPVYFLLNAITFLIMLYLAASEANDRA